MKQKDITFVVMDQNSYQVFLLHWKTDKHNVREAWRDAEAYVHERKKWPAPDALSRRLQFLFALKGHVQEITAPLRALTVKERAALAAKENQD